MNLSCLDLDQILTKPPEKPRYPLPPDQTLAPALPRTPQDPEGDPRPAQHIKPRARPTQPRAFGAGGVFETERSADLVTPDHCVPLYIGKSVRIHLVSIELAALPYG
jgi:hypothetical protein